MDKLLEYFKETETAIQITIEPNKLVTVHGQVRNIGLTETVGWDIYKALKAMRKKVDEQIKIDSLSVGDRVIVLNSSMFIMGEGTVMKVDYNKPQEEAFLVKLDGVTHGVINLGKDRVRIL